MKCELDNLAVISGKLEDRVAGIITKGKKPTKESIKRQVATGLVKAIFMITINMLGDTLTCRNLFCRFINTTI